MNLDDLRHLVDDLTGRAPDRGGRPHEAATPHDREAAAALAAIATQRRDISAQRASVQRILDAAHKEARATEAEQSRLVQRLHDLATVADLGVTCDSSREAARLAELERRLADIAEQRTRLGALDATLGAKLDELASAGATARTQIEAAHEAAQRALPTDLRARHARGEAVTPLDVMPEGEGWTVYLQAADGVYRLRDAGDFTAPAEQVRERRSRKDWNPRAWSYTPADGLIAPGELGDILARTRERGPRPAGGSAFRFVAAHLTHRGPQGEPHYLVVLADGVHTLEMSTYQQFMRVAGYSQAPAAVDR